jgi:glutamate-ammonia-ligase adenylyltransferase
LSDVALLARWGFREPERALGDLPPNWRDDPSYVEALGRTADPDAALRRLKRLDAYGNRELLPLVGFGEYLTELLARPKRSYRDAEILRIAAKDLASAPTRGSFEETTRALSDLADECVRRLLTDERIAVMAMGKYGAQELNYASDIDVLFVVNDDPDGAAPVVRRLMQTMNGPPVIFRVDADLRPEGRNGPLVRTIDAYREYYARWAQVWEFQALIKCRFAVGNASLGREFEELIVPFVWPETLAREAIEHLRALKARAEQEVARRGLQTREVKLGTGGIRDIEFAVQLLQLVHGRHHAELRARSTLGALDILGADGYIGEDDARELADAYVFLRHVEHRVQLESGRQTHTLPDNDAKRELIGRAMGFADLRSFESAFARTTNIVRSIHERLFYRPLLEAFAAAPALRPALSVEEAHERLTALGFDRAPRVRDAIVSMTSGGSRRAKLMRAILPGVLAWMAETPEPDAGMVRLADVTRQLDSFPHILTTLRDEPPVAELLCRVLGTGPVLAELIEREPNLISALGDAEPEQHPRVLALSMVRRASSVAAAITTLRRFKAGEFVRIAARDLASDEGPSTFLAVSAQLSDVGDACIDAALQIAWNETAARTHQEPPGSFAVIGLGRFGGRELSFASDLDVVFVFEHDLEEGGRRFYAAVAERIVSLLGTTPPIFRVDTELRPEGRSGAIVRSLDAFREYYERRASLWEFQALTRARHVAGDPALTQALLDAVASRVWRPSLSAADIDEIRRMKARIERERVRAREDPRFQVKLGVGGLADIEFTVQLLQMRDGCAHPDVRTPNTYEAIGRLERAGSIETRDADWLRDAYLLLNRVRNHMFLLRGLVTDALPSRDDEVERLARSLGYGRMSRSSFLERYMRVTRRARRVTDRLFYGET